MGNHLFVIFAVLDVSLAVNSCLNRSFFTLIIIIINTGAHNCNYSYKTTNILKCSIKLHLERKPIKNVFSLLRSRWRQREPLNALGLHAHLFVSLSVCRQIAYKNTIFSKN